MNLLGHNFSIETDETAFVHHRKKMIQLDWEKQPDSVSLFVQLSVSGIEAQVEELKQFLNSLNIRVSENKYEKEDFIILIGTDGFNLQVSQHFQNFETPPIISFTPTKKGFISFIELLSYKTLIPQILRGNCWIMPRCRLYVEYHSFKGLQKFLVLNDIVVSRSHESCALVIDCISCGFPFSQLIGDGLIVSTPTGSTAYNKGAGGALLHPLLPVFLLTPINALSLSARPILFPQSADLTISLEETSKEDSDQAQCAYLSFDGISHSEFKVGEKIVISISPYSFNSIMMSKSIAEWPIRLAGLMGWNERKRQKALPKENETK